MGDKEMPEKLDESSLLMTDTQKKVVKEWIEWLLRDCCDGLHIKTYSFKLFRI